MRKIGIISALFCLLVICSSCWAQDFTLVSGNATDPNGIPYAGGTITSHLITNGVSPTLHGLPFDSSDKVLGLDASGNFNVSLVSSIVMSPNLNYSFTICSAVGTVPPALGVGSVCFSTAAITISGSTQSITSSISSVVLSLLATGINLGGLGANNTSNPHALTIYTNNGGAKTAQADTGCFTDGAGNLTCNGVFVGAGTPNSSTGTTLNGLAKYINTTGVCQLQGTVAGDSTLFAFPVIKGAGTSGNAYVAGSFTVALTYDNTAVNDNWAVLSSSAGLQVHDSGIAITSPAPANAVGFDCTPGTGAQTVVWLPQQGVPLTTIQNGGVAVTPSAGAVNLIAGGNVTLTTASNGITIASGTSAAQRLYFSCGATLGTNNGTAYSVMATQNPATTACTGTEASAFGFPFPAVTVTKLVVSLSAACANAGTTIAVFKNGSATSMTIATLTTTPPHIYFTTSNQPSFNGTSDVLGIAITTGQASETCANPRGYIEYQ